MDPSRHRSRYPYSTEDQPLYITPPPSFLGFHGSILPDPAYNTSYEHIPSMPVPINPNFRTYIQTPTPDHSVSPPLLPEDLTAASAALSLNSSPQQSFSNDDTVSVSTVFHPGGQPQPDAVVSSSDGVLFYVHSPTLLKIAPNVFQQPGSAFSPLSNPAFRENLVQLDAPSEELNIILHALYGTSPAAHSPSFDTLIAAVDRMPDYKISPKCVVRSSTPLYELLLSYAPIKPLELYALGAFYDIHSLAVNSSSHLLSYDLTTITDQVAERIGAVYLKKLLLLHSERFDSLNAILLRPLHPHPTTRNCTFQDQRKLTRAWALVSAHLAWDARADLSTQTMKSMLNPLVENLTCDMCREALQDRIKNVLAQWSTVKRTI